MRMTMKDTIAKQKSDIDNLRKEIKLKSVEVEDLRKKISESKEMKKMTQKEWRQIDEEWCSIMEAKALKQSQTDLKPALPIKEETNNISNLHKITTTETKSVSNNEPTKEVELSPFNTIREGLKKK